MHTEPAPDLRFEIGHVLFMDIVGYSKLLINEQSEVLRALNEIVRGTDQFRLAQTEGKLVPLPTGDGMALVFRNSPEAPVQCALEISQALKDHPKIPLRMGIHSGPVNEVTDVSERANVAGAGINMAQRVMDCGDTGHILLSKHVAEDLEHYARWQPLLHHVGECEVKHAVRVSVVNLYTEKLGNPRMPQKLFSTNPLPAAKIPFLEAHQRAGAVAFTLRRGAKRLAIGVGLLLVMSVALGIWILQRQQRATKEVTETRQALISVQEKMNELLRQGVSQFAGVETKIRQEQSGRSATELQQRIYNELGKQLGVDPQLLQEKLPQFAKELKNAPNATTYERANGAYVSKDYAEAERLALVAAAEAQKARPPSIFDAIEALELAGRSADARIEYAEALRHFRDAQKLTEGTSDPGQLRHNLQLFIAWVLQEQGKYADAEMIFRALLDAEQRATFQRNQAAKAAPTQQGNEYWITPPPPPAVPREQGSRYARVTIVGDVVEKNKDLGLLVHCDSAPGSADNESVQGVILLRGHPDFKMLSPGDRVEVRGVAVGTQEYRPPSDVLNSDAGASLGQSQRDGVITVHVYQFDKKRFP